MNRNWRRPIAPWFPASVSALSVPGMPMAQIENLYGTENLRSHKLVGSEGESRPGYLLFPGRPDELEIALGENKQPAYVTITNPRSPGPLAPGSPSARRFGN